MAISHHLDASERLQPLITVVAGKSFSSLVMQIVGVQPHLARQQYI